MTAEAVRFQITSCDHGGQNFEVYEVGVGVVAHLDTEAQAERIVAALKPREEPSAATSVDPVTLARLFHETYERLAPDFDYKTREASAVPWGDVPENNRRLMIAVAGEVAAALTSSREPEGGWPESFIEGTRRGLADLAAGRVSPLEREPETDAVTALRDARIVLSEHVHEMVRHTGTLPSWRWQRYNELVTALAAAASARTAGELTDDRLVELYGRVKMLQISKRRAEQRVDETQAGEERLRAVLEAIEDDATNPLIPQEERLTLILDELRRALAPEQGGSKKSSAHEATP